PLRPLEPRWDRAGGPPGGAGPRPGAHARGGARAPQAPLPLRREGRARPGGGVPAPGMVMRGTVLEREGGTFRVLTEQGEVRAALRGKTKRGTSKVVVGDRVTLEDGGADLWGIAAVDERASVLSRRVPGGRGLRPVVANVDQVVVVTAAKD